MLSIRDPSQNKRSTQAKNEGMGKNIPSNLEHEKTTWGSHIYIRQNRSQNKGHTRDKEGHYIILKGVIQQEDIILENI